MFANSEGESVPFESTSKASKTRFTEYLTSSWRNRFLVAGGTGWLDNRFKIPASLVAKNGKLKCHFPGSLL